MILDSGNETNCTGQMSRLRLAIVVTHPIQYHAPLYRLLASSDRVRPQVLFLTRHGLHPSFDAGFSRTVAYDVPLTSGYEHFFLKNLSIRPGVEWTSGTFNPGLLGALTPRNFDAVLVHGYNHLSHWLAFLTARARHLPYLLRGESRVDADEASSWLRQRTKQALLRPLIESAGACLAIGELNRRFYRSFGAPSERIVDTPYSVDNERFRRGGASGRRSRGALLAGVGLDPALPVVLFVGKLQWWKRPGDLLDAFRRMSSAVNGVIIGDGPLSRDVENAAASLPRVRVLGFVNQLELPRWYGAADIFVLPSQREPWGLVVNEAIAAGCVAVSSDRVGCAPDLLTSDRTFRPGHPEELAAILERLCSDTAAMAEARRHGTSVIDRFSLERTAAGIERGTETAVQATRR